MDENRQEELAERFALGAFLEAVRLLEEGGVEAEDIDVAMRVGAGFRQGPLAWADDRGLDIVLARLRDLELVLGSRFSPPDSLKSLVSQGRLGAKSGRGYLDHRGGL